jgi:large subunit ribosomal protein L2
LIDSLKKIIYTKGDALAIKNINIGCLIYNLSNFKKLLTYIKSGGAFSKILIHKKGFSLIELKSGEFKLFNNNICVNIGIVLFNILNKNKITAGKNRNLGLRPTVRGVAKNPIDHPNGGSASGGKLSRNK